MFSSEVVGLIAFVLVKCVWIVCFGVWFWCLDLIAVLVVLGWVVCFWLYVVWGWVVLVFVFRVG